MFQYFDDEVYVEIIKYWRRLLVHGHSPAAGRFDYDECDLVVKVSRSCT